ncbi:hypothetical protein SAMN05428990_1712 [Pseudoxanthomonas sp. YR558]|nr:hypothetical protein SAMN05428990_1712 [Pseudoxanthomonas sp. YR558]
MIFATPRAFPPRDVVRSRPPSFLFSIAPYPMNHTASHTPTSVRTEVPILSRVRRSGGAA